MNRKDGLAKTCTLCGCPGHKRTDHGRYQRRGGGPARRYPADWYVSVRDISDAVDAWWGPLPYSTALAVARLLDVTLGKRQRTLVTGRLVCFQGEPMPLPDGWQDYRITDNDRVARINVGHARIADDETHRADCPTQRKERAA